MSAIAQANPLAGAYRPAQCRWLLQRLDNVDEFAFHELAKASLLSAFTTNEKTHDEKDRVCSGCRDHGNWPLVAGPRAIV